MSEARDDSSDDGRDDYDPPERLRHMPTWLTSQVARKGQQLVADALAGEGLRRQHFTVLMSLADQGPASQADLGRRLWIDRSDLHAILNELERDGLLERVRDQDDRRRNVVTLTPKGRSAFERLEKVVEAAQAELLAPLSARDRHEFRRLLEVLASGR